MREAHWKNYSPGMERYFGAKLLSLIPYFYGEKGNFIVGLYAYLRWIDDEVDEGRLYKPQKLEFLDREMGIVAKFVPEVLLNMEKHFLNLPWNVVPENEIRHRTQLILGGIRDDVSHQGFEVRTKRQIRHYNLLTILPVLDGVFLSLNGKAMREKVGMARLLNAYMTLGNLEGINDDLDQKTLKLPLEGAICSQTTSAEILATYTPQKIRQEELRCLIIITENLNQVYFLDIPAWQKLASLLYLSQSVMKRMVRLIFIH